MKNKFLSKIIVAICLVVCSVFAFSACSFQKDVNIKSIQVVEGSVPSKIQAGSFDAAGIKLEIIYEDDTKETIDVTSSLVPEDFKQFLNTPGNYEIEIVFKGQKTVIDVSIAEDNVYIVDFYNSKNRIISRQFVLEGEDAVEPTEDVYVLDGYEFMGWDRTFDEITENTKVYGIYMAVNQIITADVLEEKFNGILDGAKVQDLVISGNENDKETYVNYHGKANGLHDFEYSISTGSDFVNVLKFEGNIGKMYILNGTTEDYQELTRETLFDTTIQCNLEFADVLNLFILLEDYEKQVIDFDYEVHNNVNMYTLCYKLTRNNDASVKYVEYIFNDEELIQVNECSDESFETVYGSYYIEYTTVDFDDNFIPEGYLSRAEAIELIHVVYEDMSTSNFSMIADQGDSILTSIYHGGENPESQKILKMKTGEVLLVENCNMETCEQYYYDTYEGKFVYLAPRAHVGEFAKTDPTPTVIGFGDSDAFELGAYSKETINGETIFKVALVAIYNQGENIEYTATYEFVYNGERVTACHYYENEEYLKTFNIEFEFVEFDENAIPESAKTQS